MHSIASIGLGFIEGLSLFLSPCILPVLPIVLSASIDKDRLKPYGIIIGFVIAFTGFTLFSRQLVLSFGIDPGVLRQVSFGLLLLMGLFLLSSKLSEGFARWTQGLAQAGNNTQQHIHTQSSLLTGILIGACIGLVWVPCSGPILAAVLVQSITQHTTLGGFLTVVAFAVGAGLPMLLFAIGGNRLMKHLNFFKRHGEAIRKLTGAIIILTVIFTAQDTLTPLLSWAKQGQGKAAPVSHLQDGLQNPYSAPELTGLKGWINSQPLTLSQLKGKVVLIDFWTYSCINCVRTLPYIKGWDSKYRKDGLVIIGVHAPEFEFERNANNVAMAVKKQGLNYPVALDSNLATWQAFHNQYWPAQYLIDKSGKVVYTHFGEGNDDVTEKNIRYLLGVNGPALHGDNAGVQSNANQSPETYLGYARAEHFASPQGLAWNKVTAFTFPPSLEADHWALQGQWRIGQQFIQSQSSQAALRYKFNAKHVYLVLGLAPHGKPISVDVLLNGARKQTLTVSNHTLYTLLDLPKAQAGTVELKAHAAGLQAYAFTFG